MARGTVAGIDIGTFQTKVIVAQPIFEQGHLVPKILGTGISETKGVQRGYITNFNEASESLRQALAKAEKASGERIRRAYVSFGGVGLESTISSASVAITRADLEITDQDLAKAYLLAEQALPQSATINRKIVNTIPIEYKLDGRTVWGRVEGLKAQRVEVKVLFITCLEHHLDDLIRTVESAGVEVIDISPAPVASSFVTLTKKQKKAGAVLAVIGAETLSVVVYEENNLISLEVFPIGGNDVTNDIALGLKITLEDAEETKRGDLPRLSVSKKKLDEIISARMKDCFELINSHLKKIGRQALLPAGILLTGGVSHTFNLKQLAETELKLPAQIAEIYFGGNEKNKIRDNVWSVACGLLVFGLNSDDSRSIGSKSLLSVGGFKWLKKAGRWFAQFLP